MGVDSVKMIVAAAAFLAAGLCSAGDGAWRNVGIGGGGWVQSVLASRHDIDRMFVGCDVAGFFRSDDGGRHYRAHNTGLNHIWVSTIAEHPSDPMVVFIGSQGGIYKSVDGGLTWVEKREGLPKVRSDCHSLEVCKFAFDPKNPAVMYAAEGNPRRRKGGAKTTVWKSTDCGESWFNPVRDGSFPEKTHAWDLAIDASNGVNLIISTNRGLFRSGDAGETWVASNAGLPPHLRTRILARSPSSPNVVYVSLQAAGGERPWAAGIYRSDDDGRTWRARNGGLQQLTGKPGEGAWKVSWYDCIAVDPFNPDVVYASGASWVCDSTWKTTDGGANWREVFRGGDQRGWCSFWGPWVVSMSISARYPGTVVFGTAGAVYRTEDGGANWHQRYTGERADGRIESTGLELTCMFDIVPDSKRRGRYFLCYADTGLFLTEDDGRTCERVMSGTWGDCFALRPSPDDSSLVWGAFGAKGSKPWHKICESRDGGRTWAALTEAKDPWSQCWPSEFRCMTKAAPYRLAYVAGGYGIAVSEDSGRTWAQVSTNALPGVRRTRALIAEGTTMLAGLSATDTVDGEVWRSIDAGKTWRRLTPVNSGMGAIRSMAERDGNILVGTRECWSGKGRGMRKGGVWLSKDAGATWKLVFKDKFCNAVIFAGDRMIAGMNDHPYHDHCVSRGVFCSFDGGETWESLSDDSLDNRNIGCFAVDPFDHDILWTGTGGNSAFVRKLGK